jgi:hypothetical protein
MYRCRQQRGYLATAQESLMEAVAVAFLIVLAIWFFDPPTVADPLVRTSSSGCRCQQLGVRVADLVGQAHEIG